MTFRTNPDGFKKPLTEDISSKESENKHIVSSNGHSKRTSIQQPNNNSNLTNLVGKDQESILEAMMERVVEKVISKKMEDMRREILESIEKGQRDMHIEIIRQFEIQKDLVSSIIDSKAKTNNDLLAEYIRVKEQIDLFKGSNI